MKPILFNTEMVRAILDGRKTVTRRVVKLPSNVKKQDNGLLTLFTEGECYENNRIEDIVEYLKQPFKVNDILYVRETWREHIRPLGSPKSYGYRAATDDRAACLFDWKPSIHMPKEAARIFLKVTGVRAERLQDMKKEDCEREGLEDFCKRCAELFGTCDCCANEGGIIEYFKNLWDSTIKKDQLQYYSWDANPYVWVIEFEVIDKAAEEKEG